MLDKRTNEKKYQLIINKRMKTGYMVLIGLLVVGVIVVIVGFATNWFSSSDDDNDSASAPSQSGFSPTKGVKCTCDIIKHEAAGSKWTSIVPGSTEQTLAANEITIDLRCQTSAASDNYAKCGCKGLLTVDCGGVDSAGTATDGSYNKTKSAQLKSGDDYTLANNVLTSILPAPRMQESEDVNSANLNQVKTSGSSASGVGSHRQIVYQKVKIPTATGETYTSLNGTVVNFTT